MLARKGIFLRDPLCGAVVDDGERGGPLVVGGRKGPFRSSETCPHRVRESRDGEAGERRRQPALPEGAGFVAQRGRAWKRGEPPGVLRLSFGSGRVTVSLERNDSLCSFEFYFNRDRRTCE